MHVGCGLFQSAYSKVGFHEPHGLDQYRVGAGNRVQIQVVLEIVAYFQDNQEKQVVYDFLGVEGWLVVFKQKFLQEKLDPVIVLGIEYQIIEALVA